MRFLEGRAPKRWLWPLLVRSGEGGFPVRGLPELARAHRIACTIVDELKRSVWRKRLAGFATDLLISPRFSHIFQPAQRAIPRFGTVNLYRGELPAYPD